MLAHVRALPQAELLATINKYDVAVVSGGTGSGKSTQVPQFILDELLESGLGDQGSVICTQPRRIAAVGVAMRIADERGEGVCRARAPAPRPVAIRAARAHAPSPLLHTQPTRRPPRSPLTLCLRVRVRVRPDAAIGKSVGYSIRLETKRSAETKLLFCTIGVLLQMLTSDRDLAKVSHVVIDEVHERSCDNDLLLAVVARLLQRRRAEGESVGALGMTALPCSPHRPCAKHNGRVVCVCLCVSRGAGSAMHQPCARRSPLRLRSSCPAVARHYLAGQRTLKVVLMSATLAVDEIKAYFGKSGLTVGAVSIKGRTFPVTRYFLSDAIEQSGYTYGVFSRARTHVVWRPPLCRCWVARSTAGTMA